MGQTGAESLPARKLLTPRDDPPAVSVVNSGGASCFLLIGDHAGRAVPRRLAGLGLPPGALDGHIAWDIGVAGLGERLAEALDAPFVAQAYSRLVIDCNRRPGAADAAPETSDGVAIPGNRGLDAAALAARHEAIYRPYHQAIAAALDARRDEGRATFLVSLHSFTPALAGGPPRPWTVGVLHRGDSRLSHRMVDLLRGELGDAAGDNQPYRMDETDNTVPLHADPRGLDYLELEVRQDLIADAAGQAWAAALLARLLPMAAG